MKRFYIAFFLLLCCLLLLTLVMIPPINAKEKSLEHVKLIMDWFPHTYYAPFLIAQEKGFFKEQGLEVEIVPGAGSSVSAKVVGNKENDFGLADATTIIIARAKGMPLVALAVLLQRSPVGIFSLKESKITKPKDLIGKRISCDVKAKKHNQVLIFLKKNNINPESITFIPTIGAEEQLILTGNADASEGVSFRVEAVLIKKGKEYNKILLDDYGMHLYDTSIITHEDMIKQKPKLVKRFMRASLKGFEYAMNNPEEAIDALIKQYPEMADKENEMLKQRGMFKLMESKATKEHGLGYQTKEGWEETQNLIFELGLIEKKINISEIYTNDFR